MRLKGKIASGALAMVILCGILGLVWLVALGTKAPALRPEELTGFYVLLGVMGISMAILFASLLGKK